MPGFAGFRNFATTVSESRITLLKNYNMPQVLIDIPPKKIDFFLELAKNLGFKKIRTLTKPQQDFVRDLKLSLEHVKLHSEGKIELQAAKNFIDEL